MVKFSKNNKFLVLSIALLLVLSVIDMTYTYKAFDNAFSQVVSMLMIVPPIFLLIGLFDVWIPRETVIRLMGDSSGAKGMALAFFLGAFSAGPTIAAFPLALVMIKKGAKFSNVVFFLMVWSSLKLPIVIYQFSQLGFRFAMMINVTMLVVFVLGALLAGKMYSKEELDRFLEKAHIYS